jgi:hypothetical protein
MKQGGFFHKDTDILNDVYSVRVNWSEDLGKELWDQYLKKGSISTKDKALQAQLDNLIFVKNKILDYYGIDNTESIKRTLLEGPSYAKYVKKSLEYGFILNNNKNYSIEGFKPANSFKEYFPEYLLPFWYEETDDITYSFLPEKPISKKVESEYKQALLNILPDNVNLDIHEERFLNHFSTSSSFLRNGQGTVPHLVQAWKTVPTIPRVYNCKRVEIPIEPANIRDAVILDPDALYAVEILAQRTLRILKRIRWSLMGRDNNSLQKRVDYLLQQGKKFSCYKRDYKKEGLSRPRKVFEFTLDVLCEKYPKYFDDFYLFLNYSLVLDKDIPNIGKKGETVYPLRGTGLGMMNEIVTLISCAKTEMIFNRIERSITEKIRRRIQVGIWNDDSVFVGKRKYVEFFRQVDLQVCDQLDYYLNQEKTVVIDNSCWILGMASSISYDTNKDYFFRTIIWSKSSCRNICFAKSFIKSLTFPESVMDTVTEFISNFGYEFYPEERNEPAAFGGWIHPKKNGIDTTLERVSTADSTSIIRFYKAYHAIKEHPTRIKLSKVERKLKESEFRGCETRFQILSTDIIKNKFFDLSVYFTDQASLKKRLVLSMTMKERSNDYWRITSRLRLKKYKEKIDLQDIKTRLINEYLEEKAGKLVALPREYILEETHPEFYCQYKKWYPELDEYLDPIELIHRAQLQLEPESNKTVIHQELTISNLRQLDLEVEPKANVIMPGTLPWSRQISKEFLAWCPNPFIWLNYYNSNEQEIRFCKIPTVISDSIKLPEKASYYFAKGEEKNLLIMGDIYLDCLLSMKEMIIWDRFGEIEEIIHGHQMNWTTPTYVKDMWKMLKKWKLDVTLEDTAYSIAKKYQEAERRRDEFERSKNPILDYNIDWTILKDEKQSVEAPLFALQDYANELDEYIPTDTPEIPIIQEVEINYYESEESSDHGIDSEFIEAKINQGSDEEKQVEYLHESDLDEPSKSEEETSSDDET